MLQIQNTNRIDRNYWGSRSLLQRHKERLSVSEIGIDERGRGLTFGQCLKWTQHQPQVIKKWPRPVRGDVRVCSARILRGAKWNSSSPEKVMQTLRCSGAQNNYSIQAPFTLFTLFTRFIIIEARLMRAAYFPTLFPAGSEAQNNTATCRVWFGQNHGLQSGMVEATDHWPLTAADGSDGCSSLSQ